MTHHTTQQLTAQLAEVLLQHGWMLATAESCTGGLIAAQCTELAGSSLWFERGFVSYSNAAKTELIGVPAALIAAHGAVSEVVARAMAHGAARHSRARATVAVTGIAGPDGGTPEKPVGTVCFAWASKDHPTKTCQLLLSGNRQEIRQKSVSTMLSGLKDFL